MAVSATAMLHNHFEEVVEVGCDSRGAIVHHFGKAANHHSLVTLGVLIPEVLY